MFPAISTRIRGIFFVPPGQDRSKNVPDRVMVKAFQFLSIEGLGSAARVNKKWNGCVGFNNDILWKEVKLDYPLLTRVDEREWRKLDCNLLQIDPSGAPQIADKATLKAVVTWMKGVFRESGNEFPAVVDLTFPKGYANGDLEQSFSERLENVLKQHQKIGNHGSKPISPETLQKLLSVTFYNLPESSWVVLQTERVFVSCKHFSFATFLRHCPSDLSQMRPARYEGAPLREFPIIGYQRPAAGVRLDYIRRRVTSSCHSFLRLACDPHTTLPEDLVKVPDEESIFKAKKPS